MLGLNYHERANWQKVCQFVDIRVVDRNAAGGPINLSHIEIGRVGAMNADLAAFAGTGRYQMCRSAFLKSLMILFVGIINVQKPSKASAAVFTDDQIVTFGRAAITLP